MDLLHGLSTRQSIRGFLPYPVQLETIEEILAAGQKAPSAMNSQPWEFVVLTGNAMEAVKRDNASRFRAGESPEPEFESGGWPKESRYRQEQVALAKQLFASMGIDSKDKEARNAWAERGFRFFDAPAAIILCVDRCLPESGPLMDLGAVMQSICLAALSYDLGTCIASQGVGYPEVIREHTGLSQDKRIIISIALGYPDWEFPANRVVTEREDLQQITYWIDEPQGG